MAKKKKNSMALFEVVGGGSDGPRKTTLSVPDWMKKRSSEAVEQDASPQAPGPADDVSTGGEPPEPPEPPEAPEARDQAVTQYQAVETPLYEAVGAPGETAAEAVDADGEGETDQADAVDAAAGTRNETAASRVSGASGVSAVSAKCPPVGAAGGRVTFSLNYVSCAVAGLGVMLALVLAFMLGRSSAPVPGEPADSGARAGLAAGKRVPRRPGAGRSARISGKHYLVIQQLGERTPGAKAAAEAIVAYCETVRGDRATVVDDGRQYLVLSGVAFDSDRSAAALEYAADVHALGRRYKADENSKVDFNQMDRQGRLDPWFVTEP